MVERRFWKNFVLIFVGLLVCVSIWQRGNEQLTPLEVLARDNEVQFYTPNNINSTYSYPFNLLSPADYTQNVNLYHFRFNNLVNDCDPDVFLVVGVHTAPANFEKRKVIRTTWGNVGSNVKVVFMVGEIANSTVQEAVFAETGRYKDIVHGNFLDTYRNLSYKHMMSLKFAIYHCPHAKYVLKVDDDVVVNMPTLVDFLRNDISMYGARDLLLCTPKKHLKTIRSYRSKWRVSFKEYANKYYPTYCPGFAILYSPDVLFKLYVEAQKMRFFWIDDVFLTGFAAHRANIQHTNVESLVLDYWNLRKISNGFANTNNTSPFLFSMPDLGPATVIELWDFIKGHNLYKTYYNFD